MDTGAFVFITASSVIKYAVHYFGLNTKVPRNARKVGTVKNVWLYPVKSAQGVTLERGKCTYSGLEFGGCLDR